MIQDTEYHLLMKDSQDIKDKDNFNKLLNLYNRYKYKITFKERIIIREILKISKQENKEILVFDFGVKEINIIKLKLNISKSSFSSFLKNMNEKNFINYDKEYKKQSTNKKYTLKLDN